MSEKKVVTFGRVFWPSLLAVFIIAFIGMIIFFMILGGIVGSLGESKPSGIGSNTVLHLTLEGNVVENSSSKLNIAAMGVDNTIGLSDLLYGFQEAKSDPKIKGIFLELKDVSCGIASAKEIRSAINDFEKSGKFVIGFNGGEVITQKEYYISSAANENYGFPSSMMEFVGLGSEQMYFKNTLDKIGVEMQVIRGKNNDFKSAVEPFFRTDMSDSSRLQVERYLSGIWLDMRSDISKDRKISIQKLNALADEMKIKRASDAVTEKLLDGCKYRDEILDLIAKKCGFSSTDKFKLHSFEKYARRHFKDKQLVVQTDKPNVAVVLAEGDISVDGEGMSSEKMCKYLREIRLDKNIKTVVFRVNSPGGSALASDEIWREVKLLNDKKKVIVSMGNVAASGGYFVSAPASYIFAEPTTITGSIGVFGVIPYTGKMLENHLGLTFDRASTNKHAVISTNRRLTEEELAIIQDEVDVIYQQFLERVSEGRGMTVAEVNTIARGRVWTGTDAKKIGLVDELGGLTEALNYAIKKAGIKKAKVVYYPLKKENPYEPLFDLLEGSDEESMMVKQQQLPESLRTYYEHLLKLEQLSGIQMRMPMEFEIR